MSGGPDIAAIAALIGEPSRAAILAALLDGRAMTATELASDRTRAFSLGLPRRK